MSWGCFVALCIAVMDQEVGLGAALLILRPMGREMLGEEKIYEELVEKPATLASYF